jgi:uncharacterized protein
MLGSLSRKLRALGFETSYYKEGDDMGLLKLCKDEDRILLTADRSLASMAKSKGISVFLVLGRRDSTRLAQLGSAASAEGLELVKSGPFCSVCGGNLMRARRAEVTGKVPLSVQARHRAFFECVTCGRYYWKGSHWKKLRWLGRRLSETQDDTIVRGWTEGGIPGKGSAGIKDSRSHT